MLFNATSLRPLFGMLLLLLAPVALAEISTYVEKDVSLAQGIIGTTCQPSTSKKSPTVLLLHGFASKKDEVGDFAKRLAQQLCAKGIGSLRIGFRGWGESAGNMEDITVQTELEDAEIAYQYLQQSPWVDQSRLGLVGFSMGGGIAILSTAKHPGRYKSLVTWSSVGDFKKDFLLILGQKNFNLGKQLGKVTVDLGWRKVTLGAAFFNGLDRYDLSHAIQQFDGAYLAIAGSKDFSAAYTQHYVDLAKGQPKRALIMPNADHIFGALGQDQTTAETVIANTVRWFVRTL